METIFHYGKESEKFLRDFEDRQADYSIREITDFPVEKLKALLCMLQHEDRTFAGNTEGSV